MSIPVRLVHEWLTLAAEETPERLAFVDDTDQCTYAELAARVHGLCATLVERGVQRGDRVLLFLENGVDCAVALFAVLLSGAAYSFVNPQTKEEKLALLLDDARPRVVLTERALAQRYASVLAAGVSVESVICRGDALPEGRLFEGWSEVVSLSRPRQHVPVIPLDLAALIYTSGSTGRPKGVMMTHQSMMFSISALVQVLRLEEGCRTLTVLPFSFNYGMYQMLLNVAVRGTLYIEQSFAFPATVLERLATREIQAFPGVPTIFARLLALHARTSVQLPSITRITNTAAALAEDLVRGMGQLFPNALIFRMYGLTECKRALYLEPELGGERPGSVGKALPGTEVFLRSLSGEPVPAGEPGILHVRSPGVMLGYWNLLEESERVLQPGRYPGERVFVTGDWFKVDRDGYYTFLGRSDDIIKTRGEKVSPAEVEGVLYALPGVREAAVIGIADPILGEAVRAYVAFEPGQELPLPEIKRHCMARLEAFMVPRDVLIVPELPKTDTGKIDKKHIREVAKPA